MARKKAVGQTDQSNKVRYIGESKEVTFWGTVFPRNVEVDIGHLPPQARLVMANMMGHENPAYVSADDPRNSTDYTPYEPPDPDILTRDSATEKLADELGPLAEPLSDSDFDRMV